MVEEVNAQGGQAPKDAQPDRLKEKIGQAASTASLKEVQGKVWRIPFHQMIFFTGTEGSSERIKAYCTCMTNVRSYGPQEELAVVEEAELKAKGRDKQWLSDVVGAGGANQSLVSEIQSASRIDMNSRWGNIDLVDDSDQVTRSLIAYKDDKDVVRLYTSEKPGGFPGWWTSEFEPIMQRNLGHENERYLQYLYDSFTGRRIPRVTVSSDTRRLNDNYNCMEVMAKSIPDEPRALLKCMDAFDAIHGDDRISGDDKKLIAEAMLDTIDHFDSLGQIGLSPEVVNRARLKALRGIADNAGVRWVADSFGKYQYKQEHKRRDEIEKALKYRFRTRSVENLPVIQVEQEIAELTPIVEDIRKIAPIGQGLPMESGRVIVERIIEQPIEPLRPDITSAEYFVPYTSEVEHDQVPEVIAGDRSLATSTDLCSALDVTSENADRVQAELRSKGVDRYMLPVHSKEEYQENIGRIRDSVNGFLFYLNCVSRSQDIVKGLEYAGLKDMAEGIAPDAKVVKESDESWKIESEGKTLRFAYNESGQEMTVSNGKTVTLTAKREDEVISVYKHGTKEGIGEVIDDLEGKFDVGYYAQHREGRLFDVELKAYVITLSDGFNDCIALGVGVPPDINRKWGVLQDKAIRLSALTMNKCSTFREYFNGLYGEISGGDGGLLKEMRAGVVAVSNEFGVEEEKVYSAIGFMEDREMKNLVVRARRLHNAGHSDNISDLISKQFGVTTIKEHQRDLVVGEYPYNLLWSKLPATHKCMSRQKDRILDCIRDLPEDYQKTSLRWMMHHPDDAAIEKYLTDLENPPPEFTEADKTQATRHDVVHVYADVARVDRVILHIDTLTRPEREAMMHDARELDLYEITGLDDTSTMMDLEDRVPYETEANLMHTIIRQAVKYKDRPNMARFILGPYIRLARFYNEMLEDYDRLTPASRSFSGDCILLESRAKSTVDSVDSLRQEDPEGVVSTGYTTQDHRNYHANLRLLNEGRVDLFKLHEGIQPDELGRGLSMSGTIKRVVIPDDAVIEREEGDKWVLTGEDTRITMEYNQIEGADGELSVTIAGNKNTLKARKEDDGIVVIQEGYIEPEDRDEIRRQLQLVDRMVGDCRDLFHELPDQTIECRYPHQDKPTVWTDLPREKYSRHHRKAFQPDWNS